MLFGQMITRIQFENKYMIYTRRSPSINIHTNQKYEFNDEQRSSIQSECNFQIICRHIVENGCNEMGKNALQCGILCTEMGAIKNVNLPDNTTDMNNTIKHPENRPTLNVVHGLDRSPSGGTRSRFMARCRSPPSSSFVTTFSVSLMIRSMSLFVKKCDVSTCSCRHLAPWSTRSSLSCFFKIFRKPV